LKNTSSQNCGRPPDPLDQDACRRLAAAVILFTVEEAMHPDPDVSYPARKWLESDGVLWIGLLGMSPAAVHSWIKQGCPQKGKPDYQDSDDRYFELLHWCEMMISKEKK
jgi:hypothetical protein